MSWLNAALLFAVFAGHCELMAAWSNRVHGLKLKHRVTSKVRAVHDLLVFGAVPGLLFGFGLFGYRLLRGGEWAAVPWGWKAYFALCGLGVISLLVCTARNLFRPLPTGVRRASRRIDVTAELGFKPIGAGRRRHQAAMPWNGQFTLEAVELELTLPDLPSGWDGLTIGHVSDAHFQGEVSLPFFERAFAELAAWRCDLYVFTGDLIDNPARVDWIAPTFGQLSKANPACGCRFILGNHDWHYEVAPLRAALEAVGWEDVSGRVETLHRGGDPLALAGDESPWLNGPPDWSQAPPEAFRLLLAHTPDLFPGAQREGVNLMLAGHNHGGQITLPLIGPVYAPSRHGVRYAGGTYREGATALHVSRGLSGRQPLRYGAVPEVTRLTLRCPSDAATGG
ncbi:metallophosphoesterase [Alienimonas sp. DA493]|uniref:metallophosphoesterase n=1 Tax=Alienimonas sp. DA493 TaxID=3373605 RepID=UPI003754077F